MAGQRTAVAGPAAPFQTANAQMTLTALPSHMQSLAIFYTADTRVSDVNHGQELQSVTLLKTSKERLTCIIW